MFKKFIPFAHAENIYDIDVQFFKKLSLKYLLIDLDNTLDSYKAYHASERALKLIKDLRELDIEPIIISNNRGKRVSSYANDLGVTYLNSARKPFAFKINKFLKRHNIQKSDILLVGDQMITDVLFGYKAGIRVILTEKLVKEDQITTRFNRILGRRIRRYHQKRGNLIEWKEK